MPPARRSRAPRGLTPRSPAQQVRVAAREGKPLGIPLADLEDSYDRVNEDVKRLCEECKLIVVLEDSGRKRTVFPRPFKYLVKLSGSVGVTRGEEMVETSEDVREEVLEGEALEIGGCGRRGRAGACTFARARVLTSRSAQAGRCTE